MRKDRDETDRKKVILPTVSVLMQNKQIPVEDYFVRLKTTSIHHQKFAESTDVLLNLLELEQEGIRKKQLTYTGTNVSQLNLEAKMRQKVSAPQNYKILLKGIASKNQAVVLSVHRIIMLIGDMQSQ